MSDPHNELIGEKLKAWIDHRDKAAQIAARGFAYIPDHPHDLLDATDPDVIEYCHEMNASERAMTECCAVSGTKRASEEKFYAPRICECCTRLVLDVPRDVRENKPIGTPRSLYWGPVNGRPRREMIYDLDVIRR